MVAKAKTYLFGDFRFVPSESLLLKDEAAVAIPQKALNLLEKLVENAGSVITKDELIRDVWDDLAIEESAVARTVFLVRAALGDDPSPQLLDGVETGPDGRASVDGQLVTCMVEGGHQQRRRRCRLHRAEGAVEQGFEAVGEVAALGKEVKGFVQGARVMARCKGGFAEYALVDAGEAIAIPERLSWEQAAAAPIVFLVSYDMLVPYGRVQRGDWVLVTAVSSGVGVASLQLAKAMGARVIAQRTMA